MRRRKRAYAFLTTLIKQKYDPGKATLGGLQILTAEHDMIGPSIVPIRAPEPANFDRCQKCSLDPTWARWAVLHGPGSPALPAAHTRSTPTKKGAGYSTLAFRTTATLENH